MTWILFDEADRRSPVPNFQLDSVMGRKVGLDDYRGSDNLVVFFAHDIKRQASRSALWDFAARRKDYDSQEAVILAIIPEAVNRLMVDQDLVELPFPVLSDPDGVARSKLTGLIAEELVSDEDVLVFVLDRYGAPYSALIETELNNPSLHKEILKWLEYIGMQCPE
jgi:peroxiredoxin